MNDKSRQHWPFDPMQPGDHEPARLPEELERVEKQPGRGASGQQPGGERKPGERR